MLPAELKTLEIDPGGRDGPDFGTVRPRVQIPGPRPFLYSKLAISKSLWSQLHSAVPQFPAEQPNGGGANGVVVGRCEIAGQRPVATQSPKPTDAQGRTVRLRILFRLLDPARQRSIESVSPRVMLVRERRDERGVVVGFYTCGPSRPNRPSQRSLAASVGRQLQLI
jgi:hypothetical protein